MPLNEESVLEAIKNRDEAAIARVIRAYSRLLWSVAGAVLRNIGSEQDAEECVADAFITLWEHPEKFDPARGRLEAHLAEAGRLGNGQQAACYYRDEVLPDMAAVREAADKAEALLPADALPYPDYSALLFSV